MAEKVTKMRLEVDLQCHSCYKKVKKILCKFPQIRDQEYDEKQNLVTITVVCCSPEKIRDKLCCKGGKVIKSIEIVKPKKSQELKPAEKPPVPEKPEKPQEPKPKAKPPVPKKPEKPQEPKPDEKPPVPEKPERCSHPLVPVVFCCVPYLEGYRGGPCYCGYWRPMPLPRCYGCYGHACGCGCGCKYGYGKGYWYSWCDYFSE